MFVAPGLLFLHVPRSAGTFVTNVLERGGSGSRNLPGCMPHDGVRKIGEASGGRLILGCVRDPWSWYVSFFSHYKAKNGNLTGPLADVCGNGADFKKAVSAMTKPSGQALVTSPKYPGHPSGVPQLGKLLRHSGIGLWSWYILTTFCSEEVETVQNLQAQLGEGDDLPWDADLLLDAATINEGLTEVLSVWNGPRAAETAAFAESAPPINESPPQFSWRGIRPSGRPDPRWWDAESIRDVLEVDGFLMKRFNFDKPVGARPLYHSLKNGPG